jgi:hypothetical protein
MSLSSLFATVGGQMEIDCGTGMKVTENYEKVSDEIMGCYFSHINGAENKNECYNNDILAKDNSKCCFIETSKIIDYGNVINDKRCYIIQNEYFTKEKNYSDYLLDASDNTNLNQIINTNITINCKNYAPFFYQGLRDDSKIKYYIPPDDNPTTDTTQISSNKNQSSGLQGWVIAVIVLLVVIFICGLIIFVICITKKRSISTRNGGVGGGGDEKNDGEKNDGEKNDGEKNDDEKNNNEKNNNEKNNNKNNYNGNNNNKNNENDINYNQFNNNQYNHNDSIDNVTVNTENPGNSTERNVQGKDIKDRQ